MTKDYVLVSGHPDGLGHTTPAREVKNSGHAAMAISSFGKDGKLQDMKADR